MPKLINVDEAKTYAREHWPSPVVRRPIEELLDKCPAVDGHEVVKCKDCKHYRPYEGEEHKGDCIELVGLESCVYQDDFCSYGERRDDHAAD